MMRLDKFLSETGAGTRSQVKACIRQGQVQVNGSVEKDAGRRVDEYGDSILLNGRPLSYFRYGYFMLNKPAGVVSATRDKLSETVLSLLPENSFTDLFPAGRLDKDTEGLLLITNDGALAHNLLSPKKHVDKTYLAEIERPLSETDIQRLSEGVDIGEEKITMPAKVQVLSETQILLTIREGRFHQVKRMLQAVDNRVLGLKRISMGTLVLDELLKPGECRPLTEEEIAGLKGLEKL